MARTEVPCKVKETTVETDDGRFIAGVEVTCTECGLIQTAMGTSERSINYALVQLRENCEMDRKGNFYVAEEG